jgi:hypothetical protein
MRDTDECDSELCLSGGTEKPPPADEGYVGKAGRG